MIAKMVLLLLMALSLGMSIGKHGEEQKPYNAWHSLISAIITLAILYWCGLFDTF